jgi:hypothetical protein
MMSGSAPDSGVAANRSFLMLNNQSVEFVDGAPVIKGPIWYLFWFGEKSLKGSYRQVSTVGELPLRIYSK